MFSDEATNTKKVVADAQFDIASYLSSKAETIELKLPFGKLPSLTAQCSL